MPPFALISSRATCMPVLYRWPKAAKFPDRLLMTPTFTCATAGTDAADAHSTANTLALKRLLFNFALVSVIGRKGNTRTTPMSHCCSFFLLIWWNESRVCYRFRPLAEGCGLSCGM